MKFKHVEKSDTLKSRLSKWHLGRAAVFFGALVMFGAFALGRLTAPVPLPQKPVAVVPVKETLPVAPVLDVGADAPVEWTWPSDDKASENATDYDDSIDLPLPADPHVPLENLTVKWRAFDDYVVVPIPPAIAETVDDNDDYNFGSDAGYGVSANEARLIGTIANGPRNGYGLFSFTVPHSGNCGYDTRHFFIASPSGRVIVLLASPQERVTQVRTWPISKSHAEELWHRRSTNPYLGISNPESLWGYATTRDAEGRLFQADLSLQCSRTFVLSATAKKIGVLQAPWSSPLYLDNPDHESQGRFFAIGRDGYVVELHLDVPFFPRGSSESGNSNVPRIIWETENGDMKNTVAYGSGFLVGFSCSANIEIVTDPAVLDRLVRAGRAADGSAVYVRGNLTEVERQALYDSFGVQGAPSEPVGRHYKSLDELLAMRPEFYWKDSYDRMQRFQLLGMYRVNGPCGEFGMF